MVEHDYLQVLKLLVFTPNICVEEMLKELFYRNKYLCGNKIVFTLNAIPSFI